MKPRPILRPPAEPLRRSVWLATAAGRAWQWGQMARSVAPGDPEYALAREVRARVAVIRRLQRMGASDRATLLLERLDAEITAKLSELRRVRAGHAKGGSIAARAKKRRALAWQSTIAPKVRQLIEAGKTDSNIARLLARDVRRSSDTLARFAARLRKEPSTKKKSGK